MISIIAAENLKSIHHTFAHFGVLNVIQHRNPAVNAQIKSQSYINPQLKTVPDKFTGYPFFKKLSSFFYILPCFGIENYL